MVQPIKFFLQHERRCSSRAERAIIGRGAKSEQSRLTTLPAPRSLTRTMGNAASNSLDGRPPCRRCGKVEHGGASRACRLCGTVHCGSCKKLHMIKSIGDGLGKDEG